MYEWEEIKNKVEIAIHILFEKDAFLLDNDTNERSVSHKLAEYLQILFPDWHVDCEYNRRGYEIKELEGIEECSEEIRTNRVYPDIIIHQRGTIRNLLVVEIKTNTPESVCDIEKLKLFTSEHGEYRYDFGLFIKFNRTNNPTMKWYANGNEMNG